MNVSEREQLNAFLQQLTAVKTAGKDDEAERLINEALAKQPDSAYLLVQRCLLQDHALHAAQAQIAELQQQIQQRHQPGGSGFLNNDPWAAPAGGGVPGAAAYQMPQQSGGSNNLGRYAAPQAGGLGSSFLGSVATTAAGVVAGSFLFQGIENLLGHHNTGAAWGQENHWGGGGTPEQTVVNNYYGDSDQFAQEEDSQFLIDDASDSDFDADESQSDWI
ncbi:MULTISPECIES: DUF2076 domain-containing protein [Methylomonas]|uniref:DUF2076 domain-containing protein n=1 Tax=Methylomonas TaxID=416 RepID=UPI00123192C3|nr:DUF2076 domain-containing protein [Methylomonas rhizoryzae]